MKHALTAAILLLLVAGLRLYGTMMQIEGYRQGVKEGIEGGHASGRNELAMQLIHACIGEADGPPSCMMEYEAVKNRPFTITIGEERLYCSQADSETSC